MKTRIMRKEGKIKIKYTNIPHNKINIYQRRIINKNLRKNEINRKGINNK